MSGQLRVWGVGTRRTLRPHWALKELGLDYETHPVTPRSNDLSSPDFFALNPRRKVPVLQDGDFIITESAAIVAYLAATYSTPERTLLAATQQDGFRLMEWSYFVLTELDATSLYVIRRHGKINGLAHVYGDAPEVVGQAEKYFQRHMVYVKSELNDGRRFIMGPHFTTADLLLTTCLIWARSYGIELDPVIADYMDRMTARPAYQAAAIANTPVDQTLRPAQAG
jgi:glutathione S-transferase